jgi:adenosylcobinamide kinase / adenosylcobinamide-phosphate guanylyltransferase
VPEDAAAPGPGAPAGPASGGAGSPPRIAGTPLRIAGSAGEPWPVEGCGCVACRATAGSRAPAALAVGTGVVSRGVLTAAGIERALVPGSGVLVGDVRLAALPAPSGAPPAVVAGWPDGSVVRTVLWAEGPGDLTDAAVDALAGTGLDAVALDLRGADGPPEPRRLAHALARLRAVDAVAPGADVVALGITHDLHPGVLVTRLRRWGARVAVDGSPLPASPARPVPTPPSRTLVLGPASSGKSALAEDLLAAEPSVVYAATGPLPGPGDEAWARRVAAHRERRPRWWTTQETRDLAGLLSSPGPPLLVDSLGTWVAATMGAAGAWDDAPGWREQVEGAVDAVARAWWQTRRRVVAVGEEVGWGVVPAERGTAAFREVLGGLAQRLADGSEQVLLVVAGRALELGAAP